MPITVQHQPSAGVVGQAAALGGAGEFARWWTKFTSDNKNASLDRLSRENMQKATIAAQKAAQQDAQDHSKEMFLYNLKAREQDREAEQQNRLEQMQFGEILRQDSMDKAQNQWEEKFSTQQEAKIEQLNNYLSKIDEAESDGTLRPEEAQSIRLQVQGTLAGVKPGLFPKPKSEFPEGQGEGQSWRDESGNLLTRHQGQVKLLTAAPKTPENDWSLKLKFEENQIKLAKDRLEMENKLRGSMDLSGKRLYSDAEIEQKLNLAFGPPQPRMSMVMGQSGGPAQGPAVMPPVAPPETPVNPMQLVMDRAAQNPELKTEVEKLIQESRSWTPSQISAVKHTLAGAPPGTDPIQLLSAASRAADMAR